MRPPICAVCNRDFREDLKEQDISGELVYFADFESLPRGVVGHPTGAEWFCSRHIKKAKILAHLTTQEAIKQIKLYD